tara:strand:+ start:4442 stop:8080 length:3639 start_codon:yes stop_codon:yes gene_type:complete
MAFSTGNQSFDRLIQRARSRRLTKDALSDNTINVQSSEEKQNEGNEDTVKNESQLMEELSGLGVEAATTSSLTASTSALGQAISESVAESHLGIATTGMTVGQRGQEIATEQQTFKDAFAEAFSGVGGRESVTTGLGLATYGALQAGKTELAKGLFSATQMMAGPAAMALNIIGPTQKDPMGYNTAMGSGAFRATADKVMGIHYDTAAKMAQGIAGYEQGRVGGQTISMTPGLFGIGSVLSGNVPPGLTAGMFSDMMDEAKETRDTLDEEGGAAGGTINDLSNFTSPQAAMEKGGIGVDSFSSATAAGKAGIGYSSYDPVTGQPTGAAPPNSQVSVTGTFSTDDNNDYGGYSDSDFSGFNDGGRIGMNMGDRPGETMGGTPPQQPPMQPQQTEVVADMGFVDFDPNAPEAETVNDKYPKEARKDDFVINAPAVEFAGKQDITKMIVDAVESLRQKGIEVVMGNPKVPLKEQAQIIVAQNEAMIPKVVAEEIGYDRLRKINNRGKKEVDRRKQEAELSEEEKPQAQMASKGGFIGMADGDTPYYTKEERDRLYDSTYAGDPVDYYDQQKGVYRMQDELADSTPEKFSAPSNITEQLQSNPVTPFNKGETETYNAPPLPPEGMTAEYKSGTEFGDTEQGFQYLNRTGDNTGKQGQGFNDLLLAGLRDRRSLGEFLKVSDYGGVGRSQRAAGVYFPYFNKIAIANKRFQQPYIGTPGLSGDTEVHELMHKGAMLLRQDPNFDWDVYTFGNKSYGVPDKLEAAKAEHRYIQAVVNTAFIDRELEDKTQSPQYYVQKAQQYLDYVLNDIEEDRKKGDTPYYTESDVAEAKQKLAENNNDLTIAKKTVMLTELSRVYNSYFSDEDKEVFNKVVKEGNAKFNNFDNGILDFTKTSKRSRGIKKYFSSQESTVNFNTDNIQDNFSLEEVKEIFKLSNLVMINNEDTVKFLNTIKDVAPKSTREINKVYTSPGQTFDDVKPMKKAKGGFISMADGGSVGEEDYSDFSSFSEYNNDQGGMNIIEQMNPDTIKKIKGIIARGPKRGSISALIDSLPDREALALTIFAESVVSKDSPDALTAIGETVLNRVDDKTYSFKNLNNIKDVLKSRSSKGEGSKMFSYEGLEPSLIEPRLPEMLNNTYWQKALTAADMAMDRSPDRERFRLRDDIFTYAKVGEASDRLKANKRNEYFTTIGQHDFYSRTPEKGGRISSETMGESPQFYR